MGFLLSRAPTLCRGENEGEKAAERATDPGAARNADPGIDQLADHRGTNHRVIIALAWTAKESHRRANENPAQGRDSGAG